MNVILMNGMKHIKDALNYAKRFNGQTFVIKFGGETVRKTQILPIAENIRMLNQVGIKQVIIHGGGPQVDELSNQLGIKAQKIHGYRVTDEKTLNVAIQIFRRINMNIVRAIQEHGCNALGMSGVDCATIVARKMQMEDLAANKTEDLKYENVDFGFVGKVIAANTKMIDQLLGSNVIPVLCSLGISKEYQIFNINADDVATAIAGSLEAEKFILVTNVPGVLANPNDRATVISKLTFELKFRK